MPDAVFKEQPKKVAVIGAGYIAVELAGVFQALGTDTTLLVRRDRPLRTFDSLLVDTLVSEMDKSGLTLKPHATTKVNGRYCVYCIVFTSVYSGDRLYIARGDFRRQRGLAMKVTETLFICFAFLLVQHTGSGFHALFWGVCIAF